jgi:hypothetical protein
MGFYGNLLRLKIEQMRGIERPPPDAIDERPLGIRIGGRLAIPEAPFIIAGDALSMTKPDDGIVVGHGVTKGADGAIVHRIHVGDDAMIWIAGKKGADFSNPATIDECMAMRRVALIRPTTPGEWNDWLDSETGHLGNPVIVAPNGVQYGRLWIPGDERSEPISLKEDFRDADGRRTRLHSAMLFARDVETPAGTIAEYLLVSAIDDDGKDDFIEIHLGIDATPGMIAA